MIHKTTKYRCKHPPRNAKRPKNKSKTAKYRQDHHQEEASVAVVCVFHSAAFKCLCQSAHCPWTMHQYCGQMEESVCVCVRVCLCLCVCWHGGACVGECQRPHRDVGGIVWGSGGEHWSLFFGNCVWILSHFWTGGVLKAAAGGGSGPEGHQTAQCHKDVREKRHFSCAVQSCSVPRFETRWPGSSPAPTLWSLGCITKSSWGLRPRSTTQCRYYVYEWRSEVECHFFLPTPCKLQHASDLFTLYLEYKG